MVDWPACKGHGLCAELVPELVTLDEWGYPILADRPVTRGVQGHAQRAVTACPTLALLLVERTSQSAPTGSTTPTAPTTPARSAADDPISGAIRAVTGSQPVRRRSERPQTPPPTAPTAPVARPSRRSEPAPTGSFQRPQIPEPTDYPDRTSEPTRRRRPEPEDDPITGAIRAVTGPNAAPRRTPPTGMARHATPAYGQPALVPDAEPYEPGEGFFDGYAPRDAYEQQPPTSRRQARQEEAPSRRSRKEEPRPNPEEPAAPHQPRTRREARAAQGRRR